MAISFRCRDGANDKAAVPDSAAYWTGCQTNNRPLIPQKLPMTSLAGFTLRHRKQHSTHST
jgi:hypothetical protein